MMINGKVFEAADVLAGAYKGKALEERALHVHTVEMVNDRIARVLCRSVKVENLIQDAGPVDREPTCPKCVERLAKIRAGRTPAQRQRQSREHRSGGQYAKVNPCNACGRSAGIDYFSDHRTDVVDGFSDFICLCRKCCAAGEKMGDAEALAFYAAGKAEDAMKKKPKNVLDARRAMRNARVHTKQAIGAIDDAIDAFAVLVPGGYVEAIKALRTIANVPGATTLRDAERKVEYLRGVAKSALKRINVGEIADAVGASGEPS